MSEQSLDPVFLNVPAALREETERLWLRYVAAAGEQGIAVPAAAEVIESLPRVWAASDFVAQHCVRTPALLAELAGGDLQAAYPEPEYARRLELDLTKAVDEPALAQCLRRFRRREMVRIAWRDLAGWADLRETLGDLSALARACLEGALRRLDDWQSAELGAPTGASGERQGLIVIGMGKLGAGELNFSSDIDLIFAYPEDGETRGGPRSVTHEDYFRRLGQRLIQALNAVTADGFVFRVDMRLRPFGDSGPLVMSFDAMEEYYQTHGREWERYAWIKAAVVAGDRAAGEKLLRQLRPFVFRRYLDFSAYHSLREMKALIAEQVKRKGLEDNIKLGAGGIREIEFIGQAFQLIRGGRETELQARSILTVLERLGAAAYLPAHVVADLATAYHFLRRAENRLQAYADRQTHRLPSDGAGCQRLAMAMDYADWESFARVLQHHRRRVHSHFEHLFAAPEEGVSRDEQVPLMRLWRGDLPAAEAEAVLSGAGFDEPAAVLEQITRLRESATCRHLTAQGRQRLDYLMPLLLGAVAQAERPRVTLSRVLGLLEKIARRTAYLALLAENTVALSQLVRLCAASSWIAAQLARHPLLLDELLDPRVLYVPLNRAALQRELAADLEPVAADDLEQQMEVLRHFKQTNVLRVAAADLAGVYPLMVVSDHLTEIAEVILGEMVRLARAHMAARHGLPRCRADGRVFEPGFAVIGYGKLGGIELGYGSDLDLVFLHDSAGEELGSSGAKPLDNAVYFARLGQRIIHMATAHTPSGVLYDIDMRLRPSGASGLLVSSVTAYADYQRKEAWTWEHQALVRARAVAGDAPVATAFDAVRREVLARRRDRAVLRREVREMRQRMRDELGQRDPARFDLKQDPGGIADIEFMVQYGALAWACDHPELLRYTDNIRLLEGFAGAGLMTAADVRLLSDAYRTYRARVHQLTLQDESALVGAEAFHALRAEVSRVWRMLMEDPGDPV